MAQRHLRDVTGDVIAHGAAKAPMRHVVRTTAASGIIVLATRPVDGTRPKINGDGYGSGRRRQASATTRVAVAVAAMATDEARRYGRMVRKADAAATRAARLADTAIRDVERISALEPHYAVSGQADRFASELTRALSAATLAVDVATDTRMVADVVGRAHEAWSAFVEMPTAGDPYAYPSREAFRYARAAIRRGEARRTVAVAMPYGRTRAVLTWDVDGTSEITRTLRRHLLKSSPLAARRDTSPVAADAADMAERQTARKARRNARRVRLIQALATR